MQAKIIMCMIVSIISFYCLSAEAFSNNEGYRNNVVVDKISATRIILSGELYALSPHVKINFYDFRRGDVFLRHGSLPDVKTGDTVVVKVQGTAVFEIMLSR
jgi:hypothetical protein